ncbi:MAG: zinc ribbon domain-containing protein [Candidatus Marinimicrobia bacterium]|nr:zinc ribbon domain-containing protein [Candidatus Neomarinimicrobiota bacterium]
MILHCNNCSRELHPTYSFCPYCGEAVPMRTIMSKITEEKIENPIFCPHCKKENLENALFCSSCGKDIYNRPNGEFQYCPYCGEKNRSNARHCFNCVNKFNDWYEKKGTIADKLGISGELSLYEKMNKIHYHFFFDGKITIGKDEKNKISIPCDWISKQHCEFDIKKQKFVDLDSTNGSFINRSDKNIKEKKFSGIDEFNIAGAFTFSVIKSGSFFAFRLSAVIDEKSCKEVGDIQKINSLRNHYFILINGNDKIFIRKQDGRIIANPEKLSECYSIEIQDRKFYYSEISKNIENELILKDRNILPVNWEIFEKEI